MRDQRYQNKKRRFKSGQWVQYDGMYSDDWGVNLLLIQGDMFPTHPQMGETSWTYTRPSIMQLRRSPRAIEQHNGF